MSEETWFILSLRRTQFDMVRRKKAAEVWFHYTIIERLWHHLGEMISSRHMIDHCEKLKKLIKGTLRSHFNLYIVIAVTGDSQNTLLPDFNRFRRRTDWTRY